MQNTTLPSYNIPSLFRMELIYEYSEHNSASNNGNKRTRINNMRYYSQLLIFLLRPQGRDIGFAVMSFWWKQRNRHKQSALCMFIGAYNCIQYIYTTFHLYESHTSAESIDWVLLLSIYLELEREGCQCRVAMCT